MIRLMNFSHYSGDLTQKWPYLLQAALLPMLVQIFGTSIYEEGKGKNPQKKFLANES